MTKKNILKYGIFCIAIVLTIVLHIYGFMYGRSDTDVDIDQFIHFMDMKEHYDNNSLPVLGTSAQSFPREYLPRVPGGFFYTIFTLAYKLAFGNYEATRIIFSIFCFSFLIIFIIWLFKRFTKSIAIFMSVLLLCNAYLYFASIGMYNPNITLFLSFLFLILFCEYTRDDKYSKVAALFMFPILALMAQAHFALFFSMVPTLILYLIINFKKQTKRYIIPLAISVFISFLTYLPYLISELQNGFYNTNLMLNFRSGRSGGIELTLNGLRVPFLV